MPPRPSDAQRTAAGPAPARPATGPTRRRTRAVLVATGVVAALGLVPFVVVQGVGQTRVVADPARVPARPVALVLGAGLTPSGRPSPYLQRRLDAAVDLYERGVVGLVVVSGDRSGPEYDEPGAMREHLLTRGVPVDAIVRDDAGVDTHTSCVRAHDVLGVDGAVVVTQDYHLRRALFSCRAAGVDAVGIGVSSQSVRPVQAAGWRLREVPAAVKAVLDAVTG